MDSAHREHRWFASHKGIHLLVFLGATLLAFPLLLMRNGLSARSSLSKPEEATFRWVRNGVIALAAEKQSNPLAEQPDAWRGGGHHFAEHCASCHGADGRGNGLFGKNMSPRASDLAAQAVQERSDSEIYHIIANGIRFTGMPAWADEDTPEEIWGLVAFIRHLPAMTPGELEQLRPKGEDGPEIAKGQQGDHTGHGGSADKPHEGAGAAAPSHPQEHAGSDMGKMDMAPKDGHPPEHAGMGQMAMAPKDQPPPEHAGGDMRQMVMTPKGGPPPEQRGDERAPMAMAPHASNDMRGGDMKNGPAQPEHPMSPETAIIPDERKLCDELSRRAHLGVRRSREGVALVLTPKLGESTERLRESARALEEAMKAEPRTDYGPPTSPEAPSGDPCPLFDLRRQGIRASLSEGTAGVSLLLQPEDPNDVAVVHRQAHAFVSQMAPADRAGQRGGAAGSAAGAPRNPAEAKPRATGLAQPSIPAKPNEPGTNDRNPIQQQSHDGHHH